MQFGNVEPFALLTPTLYLPDPPPMLNSAEYAVDLNQVKDVGSITSGARTADQTLIAKLFGGAGYRPAFPFPVWNNVAREVARSQHLSLIKTARLFALLGASINDGLQDVAFEQARIWSVASHHGHPARCGGYERSNDG